MQDSWASAIESLVSKDTPQREELKLLVDQFIAKEKVGSQLETEKMNALKSLITSKIYIVGSYCALTGGLYSEDDHDLVFYCQGSHLKS